MEISKSRLAASLKHLYTETCIKSLRLTYIYICSEPLNYIDGPSARMGPKC